MRGSLAFDVSDSGPADGEAVVLLHGFPQDRHCWAAVADRLNGAGLRTLAPDQRGYSPGASPRRVDAYDVVTLADDVVALLEAAGLERAHVVGHDWGGAVAWVLAARHPERVASLTVLSTPHPSALVAALPGGQALRSWYMGAFQLPRVPERLLAARVGDFLRSSGLPPADVERYRRRFADPESLRGPINWYRAFGHAGGSEAIAGLRGALRRFRGGAPKASSSGRREPVVTVPTTYVWGEHDPYLGRVAAEATSDFVGEDYRFVEVPAGHWLPELEPDLVADEVLRRVRGGAAVDDRERRLAAAEFVALTTYRRSGEPVTTPMWVAPDAGELVFTTPTGSGKVKRLRRDPRVRVQVCSRLGQIRPGAIAADGTARLAPEDSREATDAQRALRAKYGLQFAGMMRVESLVRSSSAERTIIRVRLDAS